MVGSSVRIWVMSVVCAFTMVVGATGVADAQRQNGLVNVNLENLQLQLPVSVNVPVGIAVNACGINAAAIADQDFQCEAKNNTRGLSRAIAHATLYPAAAGGPSAAQRQNGLVNVNIEGLQLQVPVSVNVPIGAAVNICGINVLAIVAQDFKCDAQNETTGLSRALAKAFLRQTA